NALTLSGTGSWTQNGSMILSGDLTHTAGAFSATALVTVQGNVTVSGASAPHLILTGGSQLRPGLGRAVAVAGAGKEARLRWPAASRSTRGGGRRLAFLSRCSPRPACRGPTSTRSRSARRERST